MKFIGPNRVISGGPNVALTAPEDIIRIMPDGNCLFRAFSHIITGSEDQHMRVRQLVVRHMRCIDVNRWQG